MKHGFGYRGLQHVVARGSLPYPDSWTTIAPVRRSGMEGSLRGACSAILMLRKL
jgi:hypothetical protein